MAKLEELTPGSLVKGILPDALAELVSAKWHGSDVIEVVYKDPAGRVGTEILFRDREPAVELLTAGRPWSFDGDGRLFRLVSATAASALVSTSALPTTVSPACSSSPTQPKSSSRPYKPPPRPRWGLRALQPKFRSSSPVRPGPRPGRPPPPSRRSLSGSLVR